MLPDADCVTRWHQFSSSDCPLMQRLGSSPAFQAGPTVQTPLLKLQPALMEEHADTMNPPELTHRAIQIADDLSWGFLVHSMLLYQVRLGGE